MADCGSPDTQTQSRIVRNNSYEFIKIITFLFLYLISLLLYSNRTWPMNCIVPNMCVSTKFDCGNFKLLCFGKSSFSLFQRTFSVYLSLITPLCTGQGKI
jgi:hypothetical protein